MVWKVHWDTPHGDGTLPFLLVSRTMRSNLDRLFYIKGALTIFAALVAVFVLPDFPSTFHRWLSPIEVSLAKKRMEEDAGVGDEGRIEIKSQKGKCSLVL
jgi:hypothetical protein